MDVSIISVSFNSLNDLRRCIASIYEFTHDISFEIIVVDNASPAGDIDRLREEFPSIRLVKSPANLGFAGANNLGFKHSSGDWIVFLNPDTELISPVLGCMLKQVSSLPDPGIAGCRLLNADRSVQTSSILQFPGILNSIFELESLRLRWPNLWGIGPLFSKSPEPSTVEAVSGACILVARRTFEKIGRFSEEYFMYSEDLDLCYEARMRGLNNYHIPQAEIVHYGGTSSGQEWQAVMKTKAELQFCAKHYGRAYVWMFRAFSALNASARLVAIALLRFCGERVASRSKLDSASTRWKSSLRTLLARERAPKRSSSSMEYATASGTTSNYSTETR